MPACGGERCCWRWEYFIRSISRRGEGRRGFAGGSYGGTKNDVRVDRGQPWIFSGSPGQKRTGRDVACAAKGGNGSSDTESRREQARGGGDAGRITALRGFVAEKPGPDRWGDRHA